MTICYDCLIRNNEINVTMIQTTCTIEAFYNRRNIFRLICCVCIHEAWIRIEVVVRSTTNQSLYACRNLLTWIRNLVGIKACIVFCVWDIAEVVWLVGKYIAVCLNQTTFLTRESTITLGISTLQRTHDRTLGSIKVVRLHEHT